jgi:HlyD family secretion protein
MGNSPIVSGASAAQQGVDFKVIVTILDTIPKVRPGLSADAEITVAAKKDALTIPIQSLTARRRRDLKGYKAPVDSTKADTTKTGAGEKEIEGVFAVKGGKAQFRPVKVGISSQKYFEVVSGLEAGEKIVSGNFTAIRELKDGQRVKITGKPETGPKEKEKAK